MNYTISMCVLFCWSDIFKFSIDQRAFSLAIFCDLLSDLARSTEQYRDNRGKDNKEL